MVVGELGLGKTTFVNTLFGDKFKETTEDHNPIRSTYKGANHPNDVISGMSMVQLDNSGYATGVPSSNVSYLNHTPYKLHEMYSKTTKIDIRESDYEEDGFHVRFTVIDTPGFGDFTNNNFAWVPIVNYIDEQHRMYMLQEEQPDRSKIVDKRVHACLYFVRPSGHGLSPLDVRVMSELSQRVNLIPIISKADSFTPEELKNFKESIREVIQAEGIEIYKPSLWLDSDIEESKNVTGSGEDDGELWESGNDSATTAVPNRKPDSHDWESDMPFAIISSEELISIDNEDRKVRGRKYDWGAAEVDNEEHCDFIKLRNVLMSKYMFDLIDTTVEAHYCKYREKMMIKRINLVNETNAKKNEPLIDSEGGTEALREIATYGHTYLTEDSRENNPILVKKLAKLTAQFESVMEFQQEKFQNWTEELEAKQDELNEDILKAKAE